MSRKHFTYLLILFASLLLLASSLPYEKDWTLKRTGSELWVYTRDQPGSDIKAVQLVMNVDASIETINDVLDDAERQTDWVFKCSEARHLGGDIDSGWYYYSRIAMPWPMDDRDLVAKVVGEKKDDTYTSTSVAAPSFIDEVPDCVRISEFEVTTSYKALDNGQTQVTYQLHSEPGGSVPTWLVNLFIDKGPVESMTKLRKMVERQAKSKKN